jgi:hypothetical protein
LKKIFSGGTVSKSGSGAIPRGLFERKKGSLIPKTIVYIVACITSMKIHKYTLLLGQKG